MIGRSEGKREIKRSIKSSPSTVRDQVKSISLNKKTKERLTAIWNRCGMSSLRREKKMC